MEEITSDFDDNIDSVEYANNASPAPTGSTILFTNESSEKYELLDLFLYVLQNTPLEPNFKIKCLYLQLSYNNCDS